MPIIFRSTPINEPFTFDSLGNQWNQDPVVRPRGYPFYHYLQTERGTGRVEAAGHTYILHEDTPESREWYTLFASFTGTVESILPQMLENRQVILTEKEQGARIAHLLSDCIDRYQEHPVDEKAVSVSCYSLLMNFIEGVNTRRTEKDPLYQRYVLPVIKEIERHYYMELIFHGSFAGFLTVLLMNILLLSV